MSTDKKITRREFIEKSAMGTAGLTIASTFGAPTILANPNPSDVVGVGVIGIGIRGSGLLRQVMGVPGTQVRGLCDAYTGYMERALNIVKPVNPDVRSYKDYRRLLENKDINAVIIATPDHLHAVMTCDAAGAGKDIYVEKNMTHTIPEAKDIVKAVKRNKRILQLGHQASSSPANWRAREIYKSGILGQVSLIKISMFRNTASGAWVYNIPSDASPQTVDWDRFLGNAPKRPFDSDRFFRWRKYYDYGTGVVGDLLSHEFNGVNFIMGIGIPKTCVASGGIYYWNDGRDVPDVFNVIYDYPDKGLAIIFYSTFSNSSFGIETGMQICGDNATFLGRGEGGGSGFSVFLEPYGERNLEILDKLAAEKGIKQEKDSRGRKRRVPFPVYDFSREEGLYFTSHMENFIDCVRTRERTRCNEDDGFEVSVTSIMSVIAANEKRQVTWDPVRQEVV